MIGNVIVLSLTREESINEANKHHNLLLNIYHLVYKLTPLKSVGIANCHPELATNSVHVVYDGVA